MTHASRSANQTKAEDFPATPAQGQAPTPGEDAAQQPSPIGGAVGDARSVPVASDQAAGGTSEQSPVVQGLHTPDLDESSVER